MTVSHPYVDRQTEHRRTPDWVVAIRRNGVVHLHRFSTPQEAWEFFAGEVIKPGMEVGR